MSNIKYQIFVSSTYEDLKEERNQVIKAILEMGHIPVGMEMFSAADEEQWRIITRQIDTSDYYVVVVAHRYGSLAGDVSYTEKEYDYAVEQKVPTLGFVIDPKASWPGDRFERDGKKGELLEKFKSKVQSKPVGFWRDGTELHAKVSIALPKAFNTQPRPGWIRSTEVTVSPDVSRELARLSEENSRLRALEGPTGPFNRDEERRFKAAYEMLIREMILPAYVVRGSAIPGVSTTVRAAKLRCNPLSFLLLFVEGGTQTVEVQRLKLTFEGCAGSSPEGNQYSTDAIGRLIGELRAHALVEEVSLNLPGNAHREGCRITDHAFLFRAWLRHYKLPVPELSISEVSEEGAS